jgi:hypothetical protein
MKFQKTSTVETIEEKELNDINTDTSDRQDFPPWSMRVLFLWLVGFLVLSGIIAVFFAYVVLYLSIYHGVNLNPAEHIFSVTVPSHVVYKGLALYFIFIQIGKTPFCLKDIGLSLEIQPRHLGFGLLIGIVLMSLQLLIHKAIYGQATLPPQYPIRFDWHLTFGLELLAFVLITGIAEEVIFRGLIYQALRKRFTLEKAMIFSTMIFALFHLDFLLNPFAMTYVVFFGLIAAFLFERTRSVNICIFLHIASNLTELLVRYGTPFFQLP